MFLNCIQTNIDINKENDIFSRLKKYTGIEQFFPEKKDSLKTLYWIWYFSHNNQNFNNSNIENSTTPFTDEKYEISEEEANLIENIKQTLEEEGMFTEEELKKQEISFTEIMTYQKQTPEEIDREIEEWDKTGNISEKTLTEEDINKLKEKEKQQIEEFYQMVNKEIPNLESYQLQNLRLNIIAGLYYFGIYKEIWEKSPMFDMDLIQKHTKNLWELRKQIIDELYQRGEL
ncbi:MAG: hypothetical protein KatS3mg129_1016 [Leptospiraceae bacterium]|nr:MAG: hypothetical protein KatS3mg129_1016 [Leptospiraceae bacterium]